MCLSNVSPHHSAHSLSFGRSNIPSGYTTGSVPVLNASEKYVSLPRPRSRFSG